MKKIQTKKEKDGSVEKTKPLLEEEEIEDKPVDAPNPDELIDSSDDEGFVEDSYDDVSEF